MSINELNIKVLGLNKVFEVQNFEREIAGAQGSDDIEFEMTSWTAPWREESLNHYLNQGWSFGIYNETGLAGYILAQPLLFFQKMTQTLWVEHISALNKETYQSLVELIYKSSKEKHLQRVVFAKNDANKEALKLYNPSEDTWEHLVVLTTKIQTFS